jgi:hypothetical protein
VLTAGAFVGVAVSRRDRRALLAGFAWLAGFEAVFQIMSLDLGRLPLGLAGPVFFIVLGVSAVTVAYREEIRADLRLITVACILLAVWAVTGFHLNGHQHGMFSLHTRIHNFDPNAEVLNEAAKTLWAFAYLVPLWAGTRKSRPIPKDRPAMVVLEADPQNQFRAAPGPS